MHAEFNSMRDIAIEELEAIVKERKENLESDDPDDQIAIIARDAKEMGIPLDFFMKNSSLLKDKHNEI